LRHDHETRVLGRGEKRIGHVGASELGVIVVTHGTGPMKIDDQRVRFCRVVAGRDVIAIGQVYGFRSLLNKFAVLEVGIGNSEQRKVKRTYEQEQR